MDTGISFERAGADDIGDMLENRTDFIRLVTGAEPTEAFRRATGEYLAAHIADGTLLCHIARSGGKIVSSVIICLYDVIPKPSNLSGRIGYIFNVYTLEAFRGMGLATKLLETAILAAKALGAGELYLSATENGKRLYEKLGFEYTENEMRLKLK
jgi:ribosomal protein S18 acetylase RimI-like enzyme